MKTVLTLITLSAVFLTSGAALATEQTQSSTQASFITSDTDRSGGISLKEFATYVEQAEGKSAQQASSTFTMLDIDRDNNLTLQELEGSASTMPATVK